MESISINLYRGENHERQGLQFDVALVITRLMGVFQNIIFETEYFTRVLACVDQLILEHQGDARPSPEVKRRAKQDAEERGPSYRFSVCIDSVAKLSGVISGYHLSFYFTEETPQNLREQAESFLRSFAIPLSNSGTDEAA